MDGGTEERQFFAHTKDGTDVSEWQPLIDHLNRTANYAAEFGRDAGIAELAGIAGLIHDLGKYSKEFQARLRGSKSKVDHATAGAKEFIRIFKGTPQEPLAAMLAYCISGHHTGLLDYGDSTDLPGDGTLTARLKTDVCDYSAYKTELDFSALSFPQSLHIRPPEGKIERIGFSLAFLTRMIYSALVDADFQETEEFVQGKKPRGGHEVINALRDKMNVHLRKFKNPTNEINRKRNGTLNSCLQKAAEKPGFFKLTVPTGGGKTLASMAFALNHAAAHGLKRIIYVIPFTTIIEQNAGVFKEILGDENVLEHHSNFDWEQNKRETNEQADDRTHSVYAKLRLAAENWDIPIVVTTNVQFFESLFANKSSRCRKLHNIARSVIIFDEAQMFPRDYLRPAMSAVWELVTNYGASAVLCTATQPKMEQFLPEGTPIKELAPNPQELFDFYKRVEVKTLADKLPDDELIERLMAYSQVLCIVNTRKHAGGLFQKLKGEGNYHLSTLMCPAHRREKLAEIRQRLEKGQVCRVVSTSVMEAGIDVDFPVGYRALAGLDSINQAAGRVNREMKRGVSEMFVFEPQSEFIKKTPRYISQAVEVARAVLRDHAQTPISIPAIEAYFGQLYSLQDPQAFDYKRIMEYFEDSEGKFQFETAAWKFQVIEDVTETVIIPFSEEARKLIEELKYTQYPSYALRKLQPYTVSIFSGEFDALSGKGAILTIAEKYAVLNPDKRKEYYSSDRGLLVPAAGGGEGLFC
jgi:CRISPR-associated endonuclease/helicase Cas3